MHTAGFLLTVYLLLSIPGFSQNIQWQKCLGGTGSEEATAIQQTTDGGYIVAARTESNDGDVSGNHGSFDYWIVKLNSGGSLQWQKSLGGTGWDQASSIQQTADGGYIVTGSAASNNGNVTGNHGGNDFWVVKLDGSGNIQWQKSLGGSGDEYGYSIKQTTDGGYIVAGYTFSNNGDVSGAHGLADWWVVKLDASGSLQWQKTLGGSGTDMAFSAQQTSDGGYIVAGFSTSSNGDVSINLGNSDAWIVKLTAAGSLQWQKSLGGTEFESARAIQQTADGGYIVAGTSFLVNGQVTSNMGYTDLWILHLDGSGNLEWQKSVGGSSSEGPGSIQQTADGGFVVADSTSSNDFNVTGNHGLSDYWVLKLNAAGNIQWQKTLGGNNYEVVGAIRQTTDGGFIIAGATASNNGDVNGNHGGATDVWLVKLSSAPTSINPVTSSLRDVSIFPNPVAGISVISFYLERSAQVSLKIFDVNGRMIKLLADARLARGQNKLEWNTSQVSAGVYTIQFISGAYSTSKKITVVK